MTSRWLPALRAVRSQRLGRRPGDAGGREAKRQPATPAASQFAPRRLTAQEATGPVMTQLTLIESALQRAAAVSSLLQGEVLGVADACVVLAEASAPCPRRRRTSRLRGHSPVGLSSCRTPSTTWCCSRRRATCSSRQPLSTVSGSAGVTRFRAVRIRGMARPSARVRGVALGRLTPVADLSRITTVERSVLVAAVSRGRPHTLLERLHFAETVGRYLTRPALPDPINEVLAPFVRRIAEKHDRESAEGRCAHKVSELRLRLRRTLTTKSRRSTYS